MINLLWAILQLSEKFGPIHHSTLASNINIVLSYLNIEKFSKHNE